MSRTRILHAVRQAQPEARPLPALDSLGVGGQSPCSLAHLTAILDFIGARVVRAPRLEDAALWMRENLPPDAKIASRVTALPGNVDLAAGIHPHDLDGIHCAVIPARFAVCENGAVWVEEADLGHRVLPVIAEQLLILLHAEDLVANMHAAYQRIGQMTSGFGLFLAGPSKTADIEQCLVIGAHGARGATVFIWG
ncbi:MAG: LUD domain-containing protein [Prosthecobacter sp.]|nr:LUD domain-containing protein [Prosthecobacter sp.]